jgi:hypothetical protein
MKTFHDTTLMLGFIVVCLPALSAHGQTVIADNYNVAGSGTGFALNTGVNSGINPPATRLTGTAASNLRYITTTTKAASAFSIASNKLRVTPAANPGRFILSADGATPFNFASALGTAAATAASPVVYDLTISMANNSAGSQRFSFALGIAEGDATTWDFGIQLYRANATDSHYTIGKRIDTAASGLASDVNAFITNTAVGTAGSEINFLVRVTDAGSESAAFNSRVQLSMDGGFSWFYDTGTDPDLPNGWRLNGAGRYIIWDVAPNAGDVTYDNFSVRPVPLSAALVSPSPGAEHIGASTMLKVAVTNTLPGDLTVTFYGREAPKPYPGPEFCIAVLPDTQNYAREAPDAASKEMWFAQTEWIVTNRVAHNIAYVAHLGDIVQSGDIKNGNPNLTEWRNATNAMYRLENETRTIVRHGIPYGLAVGNHDQEPLGDPDGTTLFYNEFFGVSRFAGRPYYGGNFRDNNDSHFDLFSASGLDFIVLYFEFGRYGSAILNWANAVLSTNQHRRAIVVTHFVGSTATPSKFSTQGAAIYNGLKENTNLFMMLGGHVTGEGSRQDTYNGNTVRTFVSNYQGRANGGSGWMRLMYFTPSNNTVVIQTYSPWLNQYETDANSEMFFTYNMQLPGGPGSPGTPYVALATNVGVLPGAETSFAWTGLQANKTYDWHVKVTDAQGNSVMSSPWPFTTTTNAAPIASNQLVTVIGDAPAALTLQASDPNGDPLTFQINSPPLDGLLTSFNPANGDVTYLPARGYRGPDRIIFQASDSFTNSLPATMNLVVVAPQDTNDNGIPDEWEATYGITDANADDDGDGQSNLAEYKANTNPTNALSVLKILGAKWQTNGHFEVTWSSVGGTRYRVQYSDGDVSGVFFDLFRPISSEMDSSPHGESSTQTFIDPFTQTGTPPNSGRYYRIKVLP